MGRQRSAGILWLTAGVSSGLIAVFLVNPIDLAIFIAGAGLAILLGLAMTLRPATSWVMASNVLGVAWFVAFGAEVLMNLTVPLEELLSVVWVFAFGVAGAVVAYLQARSGTT